MGSKSSENDVVDVESQIEPSVWFKDVPDNQKTFLTRLNISSSVIYMLLAIFCFLQAILVLMTLYHLGKVDNTIVSPFKTIVEENSPKSTLPCVYPTLSKPYYDSYLCSFVNTNTEHYCPTGYACQDTAVGGVTPFACLSEFQECTLDCLSIVSDLPLYNNNETTRVLENTISSSFAYIDVAILLFFTVIVAICIVGSWYKPYRLTNRVYVLSGITITSIVLLAFIYIMSDTLFVNEGPNVYAPCYNDDVNRHLHYAFSLAFTVFDTLLILVVFFLATVAALIFGIGFFVYKYKKGQLYELFEENYSA